MRFNHQHDDVMLRDNTSAKHCESGSFFFDLSDKYLLLSYMYSCSELIFCYVLCPCQRQCLPSQTVTSNIRSSYRLCDHIIVEWIGVPQ